MRALKMKNKTNYSMRDKISLVMCLTGFSFGLGLGITVLINGMIVLGFIDLFMSAFFLGAGLWILKKPGSTLPRYFIVIVTAIFFAYLFTGGGVDNSGFIWGLIMPMVGFFLLGLRHGFIFSSTYLVFITGVFFAGDIFYPDMRMISGSHFFRFFSTYLIITLVAFVYEKNRIDNETRIMDEINTREKLGVELLKLKRAVDQSSSIIFITDTNGYIEYANSRFEKITGYSPEEVIGLNPRILKSGLTKPEIYKELWETITSGREWHGEFINKTKDGRIYWEEAFISPIRDSDGKTTHFLAVKDDISLRKEAEEELQHAKKAAEDASRTKSEFLANMSHEIRTPLNGVIGFTDLLKNTPLTPEQKQYVNSANVSGRMLLGIVNGILDFSKIESGKVELELVKTDMFELLENSIEIVKLEASNKRLQLLLNIQSEMPRFALVDPVRLKQIFTNLLNNAVKFTKKGEIELKASAENIEGNRWKYIFSIRDTGIGITEAQKEKLFKAFSQADSSTTREFGGTGLGLIISRMIVNTMGGTIDFQSKPGRETIFYFDIIAEVEENEKIISDKTLSVIKKNNVSTVPLIDAILIAEDNDQNMMLLKNILTGLFPEVRLIEAATGSEAVSLYEKENPDIILMDIQMPEMDGIEAAKAIRKIEESSENKACIIALTADALKEKRDSCLAAGMDDYLTKPVLAENIKLAISGFLERKTLNNSFKEPFLNKSSETAVDSKDSHRPRKGLKALVVDDMEINRTLFSKMLDLCKCEAVTASSGIEAVKAASSKKFDIIFMDIKMPGMDGFEAAKKIRETTSRHIPIIALTGFAIEGEEEKYISQGMDDCLGKPVEFEKLCRMLAKHTA